MEQSKIIDTMETYQPSTNRRHQDKPPPSGLPPERPASSRRPPGDLRVCALIKRTRQGEATVRSLAPKSRVWHGHNAPYMRRFPHGAALLPSHPRHHPSQAGPAPTTACRYGSQAAGPTRQRGPGWRPSLASRIQGDLAPGGQPDPSSRPEHH